MKTKLLKALDLCETDVSGAIQRFSGDEELYLKYLRAFSAEPTMETLNKAIEAHDWENAFMAAHALKGLAGNMGFVPLFHAMGELVLLLRSHKAEQIGAVHRQIIQAYNNVITALKQCDIPEKPHTEGE